MSFERVDGRRARNLLAHRRRRLDREDIEVEPVAEGCGELPCPGPDVHQRHPRRRPQVTSDRLAPFRESVAWNFADRFVRRSGRLVVADPCHAMPPGRVASVTKTQYYTATTLDGYIAD